MSWDEGDSGPWGDMPAWIVWPAIVIVLAAGVIWTLRIIFTPI